MWFWIILTLLANKSLITSMAETIHGNYQEESPDDSMFLYLEERSIKDRKDNDDIEARRRSALDKNFMRFGRSGSDLYLPQNYYDLDDTDYPDFDRSSRTLNKNDNFIRFGRGKASDFIRFGRDPYKYLRDTRGKDKNIIRFGRSIPAEGLVRKRRNLYNGQDEKRRTNNMMRFGRNSNSNFLRFGRIPVYETDNNQDFGLKDHLNTSHVSRERLFAHTYPISILPLLKQLVERLSLENKCTDCSSTG